jgi:threonine dehydratase
MVPLTLSLVLEARRALEGRVRRTPLEPSPRLSEIAGAPVSLKLENLQLTGSFKIRGAFFKLMRLSAEDRGRGRRDLLPRATTARRSRTCRASSASPPKSGSRGASTSPSTAACSRSERGSCVRTSTGFDQTERLARAEADRTGRLYVSAYDDTEILAANGGTLAAEVLEDAPDARTFLVPVGGAGLAGGFAFFAKEALADARVVGCQLEASAALPLSLERGEAVTTLPPVATTAGGLEGGIGRTGFEALRTRVDGVALLTEEEIFEGVRFMLDAHQYLVEPSSAVTVSAILAGKAGRIDSPAVAVISGRNVALPTVRRILAA